MSTPPPHSGAPVPPNPYGASPNPYAAPQPGQQVPAQPYPAQQPYPGQPQPGQPYPGQPYAGQPHPGQQYPGAPGGGCRNCGAAHAVDTSVRAHVGVLIMMRFHRVDGPFCRRCGRAMVRIMTTKTLCQGWWSPLSVAIFTPFTLIWNLIASMRFSKLPPSEPAPGRQPLDEGPPVHARPLAYVAIVPLLWVVWIISNIIADASG
ncbi:hypothetical protein OOK31_32215 [Streptomyces sp. NBC_00249]|uniref:hypothetical protein n=1 Tax=Streptomyces sp. NBC_00249 TaxID=2975690 RepID=UPI002254B926|nr:hypothetical protein [Streptomyces sp. NBC_00249]MCX5198497.1 hypothetical protein [Streptomyces sp. NBC_00249]